MDSIFKQLFQYGFHDTEISSIDCEGLEVKLNFDKGIYLLDENGKEIRHTCNPSCLSNYFGANPSAPHYLTPVYFDAAV